MLRNRISMLISCCPFAPNEQSCDWFFSMHLATDFVSNRNSQEWFTCQILSLSYEQIDEERKRVSCTQLRRVLLSHSVENDACFGFDSSLRYILCVRACIVTSSIPLFRVSSHKQFVKMLYAWIDILFSHSLFLSFILNYTQAHQVLILINNYSDIFGTEIKKIIQNFLQIKSSK